MEFEGLAMKGKMVWILEEVVGLVFLLNLMEEVISKEQVMDGWIVSGNLQTSDVTKTFLSIQQSGDDF